MNEESEITIYSRKKITVTGVDGIVNFSKSEAVFSTSLGYLAVTGGGFVIDGFDKDNGVVTVSGQISAVFYPGGKKDDRRFFKKLFS